MRLLDKSELTSGLLVQCLSPYGKGLEIMIYQMIIEDDKLFYKTIESNWKQEFPLYGGENVVWYETTTTLKLNRDNKLNLILNEKVKY